MHRSASLAGLVLIFTASAPVAVCAQVQTNMTRSGNGLTMQVQWWANSSAEGGYSPIQIDITNSGGPRTLRFVIQSQINTGSMEVIQSLEVPAQGSASFTMSVPITTEYISNGLKVEEHGRELDKLRVNGIGGLNWFMNQAMPGVLLVSRSAPDLRQFDAAFVRIGQVQVTPSGSSSVLVVAPDKLPSKWIDFTMLDIVLVSAKELDQVPQASREALANWTMAGGNLVIYGLGDDRQGAVELKRLLDIDQRPPSGATWRLPKKEDRNIDLLAANVTQTFQTPQGIRTRVVRSVPQSATAAGQAGDGDQTQAKESAPGPNPTFSIRPYGFGQLVACSPADLFPGSQEDWAWVINSIGLNRIQWNERHGVSPRGENDEFWNFLIPGVGRAPVGGFQVLITLFALVIGPVNYVVLRRRKQLYFLIITVPTLALFTTLLLLGYAVASDGFSLRTRVRSVTLLDQLHNESVSWSRISYYAGIAPPGGLRFSPETAVYPIERPGGSSARRSLDWTETQGLTRGWVPSRTPTQLLAVAHRQGDERLEIASSPSGAVRITNNLGTRIQLLLLAGEDGNYYSARDLDRDESVRIEPNKLADMHIELRKAIAEQKLEAPADLTDRDFTAGLFGIRNYRSWNRRGSAEWQNCLMEEVLRAISGQTQGGPSSLPPRTYWAIVDQPPQVDLGVRSSHDAGSLFVIWGVY